jgi:putative ABC transport system permease protein/lipoprotein-releasing system permease protein
VVEWAESKGAEHELLLQFPANPEDDPRQFIVTGHEKLGTEAGDSLSLVKLKEGELPKEGMDTSQVLIDEGTAIFLEWKIGETYKVMFGDREKEVEITGITQGEMLRTVHFHRADLAETVGIPATSVMLSLPDGVEVDDELGSLSLGITLRQNQLDTFAELMDKQKKFFNAILFLGVLIASVVLFNTLLMNLAERDQELATLRVLGAPIGRLGWMLFLEHLVIGIVGGLIGCLFSVLGAQLMIQASVQWAFYFTVKADPSALGIILGTVVFISVALTPFGMWRIRKMDLVEKVKALG